MKLNKNLENKIIKAYKSRKLTTIELSKKFGISYSSIWRLLKKKNIKNNNTGISTVENYCKCGKKLSDYRKKKCVKCHFKYYREKNHPYFGLKRKDHSEKMKGKNNPMYDCVRPLIWRKTHSKRMRNKHNPNWQGGISNLPYPFFFNRLLKRTIRKRDNFTCQNCGLTNKQHIDKCNKSLHIHHIDYNKKNCKENNLITLCSYCNTKANYNRNEWKIFYQKKMEIIYDNKKNK